MSDYLDFYDINTASGGEELTFVEGGIFAGFPSPAADYTGASIDLNRELVHNPSTTFLARVKGSSMIEAGIQEGNIVVVDRELEYRDGDVVICCVNGEFNIKYIRKEGAILYLIPANPSYPKIKIEPTDDFRIWGVVTYIIHKSEARR